MDRDVLAHQVDDFCATFRQQIVTAAEQARDGRVLADCEAAALTAGRTLMREALQAAVQARIDAAATERAATFSPSAPGRHEPGAGAGQQQG